MVMARTPRIDSPGESSSLAFPTAVRIRAGGIRSAVRNVDEAIDMIARALLEEARRTQRKRNLTTAVRQLRQALSNEKWLTDDSADT